MKFEKTTYISDSRKISVRPGDLENKLQLQIQNKACTEYTNKKTCVNFGKGGIIVATMHNVYFVKYDVTVSFLAQVLNTVTYFVSQVLVVDTVTYSDIFW